MSFFFIDTKFVFSQNTKSNQDEVNSIDLKNKIVVVMISGGNIDLDIFRSL